MNKIEQIKQTIANLEDQLELKRVELKHEEEKEAICAIRDEAFKSAVLAQVRAGGIDENAALAILDAVGIEATEEIEQAYTQAIPAQVA